VQFFYGWREVLSIGLAFPLDGFSNPSTKKILNYQYEQSIGLFKRLLQGIGGKSDLAYLGAVTAKHYDCYWSYTVYYCYCMGYGPGL
jgi:hypothetical protein